MQTILTLQELYRPIEREIAAVRNGIADLWSDALRLVHGESIPTQPAGGKMLRPALCLLAAGSSGVNDLSRFIRLATAMELLHLAALAHDDVIDSSDYRHGTRSLNSMWDNHTAVLGGDYLVARAISIMGDYDSCAVITNAIDSVRQMAEGELNNFGLGSNHFSHDACISLARQKTASLFAVSCSTPACLIDDAPREDLHNFGLNLGIAFQLVDDLLDLSQDRETLGKPSCGDIVEGKRTLPIHYIREELNDADRKRFDALKGQPIENEDREWVFALVESTGARERVEMLARDYAAEARNAVSNFPSSMYRDSMMGITEFVVVRGS